MTRYTKRFAASGWVEDDIYDDTENQTQPVFVSDHSAIYTGLLSLDGGEIWREPNPMGFGKDEEW